MNEENKSEIKILAEFMEWERINNVDFVYEVNIGWAEVHIDEFISLWPWGVVRLIEARLHEKGLFEMYLGALLSAVGSPDQWRITRKSCILLMTSSLEHRAGAAVSVIEAQNDR